MSYKFVANVGIFFKYQTKTGFVFCVKLAAVFLCQFVLQPFSFWKNKSIG
jgi:hypothetical protein